MVPNCGSVPIDPLSGIFLLSYYGPAVRVQNVGVSFVAHHWGTTT